MTQRSFEKISRHCCSQLFSRNVDPLLWQVNFAHHDIEIGFVLKTYWAQNIWEKHLRKLYSNLIIFQTFIRPIKIPFVIDVKSIDDVNSTQPCDLFICSFTKLILFWKILEFIDTDRIRILLDCFIFCGGFCKMHQFSKY